MMQNGLNESFWDGHGVEIGACANFASRDPGAGGFPKGPGDGQPAIFRRSSVIVASPRPGVMGVLFAESIKLGGFQPRVCAVLFRDSKQNQIHQPAMPYNVDF